MSDLTLAMKERIRQQDVAYRGLAPGEPYWCGDCLEDLPADAMLHGSHICGEAVPVERAFGGLSFEVLGAEPGDLVWYLGELPPGYGRLYEVTGASARGLWLVDCELALRDVAPASVQVVRKRGRRS